jgi:hypothetical protein
LLSASGDPSRIRYNNTRLAADRTCKRIDWFPDQGFLDFMKNPR